MTGPAGHGRRRRRWPIVVAVLAAVAVVAAGLVAVRVLDARGGGAASDQSASSSPGGQSGTVLDRVEVSGRPGATPVVTVTGPLDVVDEKVREIVTGAGRAITAGSPVVLAVTAFDGSDGTNLSPHGRPQLRAGRATAEDLGKDLADQVVGRTEGTRLVFVRRVAEGQSGFSGASDIEVDVVDLLPSVATGAEPSSPSSGAESPLAVALGDEGPIISHQGDAPSNLTTQVLLAGDGAQVGDGDTVIAQFIVTGWTDGLVRTSTWSTGVPQAIDLSTAMPGLRDALVDQRVGSRIAVTIPPDQAAGDDTLCAVIDILGTEPATDPTAESSSD